jgi:D-alanine-D-alanine ligase
MSEPTAAVAPPAEPDPAEHPDERSAEAGGGRRRVRVAVVFGGRSSEHAVSCSTAASFLSAIDRDAYDVVPIGIAQDGRWVTVADDPEPLRLTADQTPAVDGDSPHVLVPTSTDDRTLIVVEPGELPRDLGEVDVVFPLLHGPFGEDGTIQGLFDLADIRYVGSGVAASAAMMDKHLMKVLMAGVGLPIGAYAVVTDKEWRRDRAACMDAVASLSWPVFVKPARAGSSMGISKVSRPEDLEEAIEAARRHDPKVVVEAAIVGREIECGVLEGRGDGRPRTSVVGEARILKNHEFYDFEAKYISAEDVELTTPADVPDHVSDLIRDYAVQAFEAAGCEGLARVDFFYTDEGGVVLNEVNTMPGFTPTSMFPRMWAATGLDYAALIDELIALALERRMGLR